MKLLLIRHGDPDYTIDSLTPKGHMEAKLLARRLLAMDIKRCYTSPLGRAQQTAEYTIDKAGETAEVLDWCVTYGIVAGNQRSADFHCSAGDRGAQRRHSIIQNDHIRRHLAL